MVINKVEWDSAFFGYSVGRVDLDSFETVKPEEFYSLSAEYKLIYIFTETELLDLPDSIQLIDKKVTFKRKTANSPFLGDVSNIHSYYGPISDDLLTLTLQSGIYSRFRLDKNFKCNEYEKMYKIWIEESLNRKNALEVFVYTEGGSLLGFITLGEKKGIADIGLIAVSEQSRGMKIGSSLVNYAVFKSFNIGYSEIQVVTQLENLAAIKLYEKAGFNYLKTICIYHYWNI